MKRKLDKGGPRTSVAVALAAAASSHGPIELTPASPPDVSGTGLRSRIGLHNVIPSLQVVQAWLQDKALPEAVRAFAGLDGVSLMQLSKKELKEATSIMTAVKLDAFLSDLRDKYNIKVRRRGRVVGGVGKYI